MGLEGDESHEDRVRREHAEAAVQRAGQGVGQRVCSLSVEIQYRHILTSPSSAQASSVDQPHPNLFEDGSPAGTLGSSKHKSWEDGAATVAQAKNLKTSPKKVKVRSSLARASFAFLALTCLLSSYLSPRLCSLFPLSFLSHLHSISSPTLPSLSPMTKSCKRALAIPRG